MDREGGAESLRLLLISDIHCLGRFLIEFNHVTGDTRRTSKVTAKLDSVIGEYIEEVDCVLISGDVTDSGRASQYSAVLEVLGKYDSERIIAIPGNHDLGNFNFIRSWKTKSKWFKHWMREYLPGQSEAIESETYFPYVTKLKDGFVLMGLDSTLSGTPQGKVGQRQLERLADFLADDAWADCHKLIMLHHDVTGDTKSFSGFHINYGNILRDKDDFIRTIHAHAEKPSNRDVTVIFGHTHVKRIETDLIENVNFISVPSIGGVFEEDYLLVEISESGELRETREDAANARLSVKRRRLQNVRKYLPWKKST